MTRTTTTQPDRDTHVRITEIYASVQGESVHAGRPCTFVRLTGCNLRCRWCDTTYSFVGGTWLSIEEIVERVDALGVPLVEITGGEPLVQRSVIPLMTALLAKGYEILLETSGSRSVRDVPKPVHVILDLKAPDSGEERANLLENLDLLDESAEIKIVLASRADYEWARTMIETHALATRFTVLLSPVFGAIEPAALVAWMLEDALPARLNLQLHKFIWPPDQKGV